MNQISNDESVLILSGSHGDELGNTGVHDASLLESNFSREDRSTARNFRSNGRRVTVADQRFMNQGEFDDALHLGTYKGNNYDNVICGHCYGSQTVFGAGRYAPY